MSPSAAVVVVGSISTDVTAVSTVRPVPGQTVLGTSVTVVLGGKGANQAVAAARAGARSVIIGCIGQDGFGDLVRDGLREGGVDTAGVTAVPGPTGVAHIRVDAASGQNDIVVVPLANSALTPELTEARLRALGRAGDVLLLQLEVPHESAARAARVGRELGMTVVLDPAPAAALPEEVWASVDVVTPNESEAEVITGIAVTDAASAVAAGRWFVERGVRTALVTLAAQGVVEVSADGDRHLPAPRVRVVDTTAAGDAFAGTLGAALAAGSSWDDAVRRGVLAGALAVTVAGASPSLPTAAAVDALAARTRDPHP